MKIVGFNEGTDGTMSINASEFQFIPLESEGGDTITIQLQDLKDVDFTNIHSKSRFFLTAKDGRVFAFGCFNVSTTNQWKRFFGLVGWFGRYKYMHKVYTDSNKWKGAFAQLTPNIFRSRKEVRIKNIIVGLLLGILLIAALLFGVVALILSRG